MGEARQHGFLVLGPDAQERPLAENPYAELAFEAPSHGAGRVLESRLIADQQDRLSARTQHAVTLAQEPPIERPDVFGRAQLLAEWRIAHNALDAAVR